ncbi:hypothetical protein CJ030_MR0G005140 [Morella rubra]|uniref:Tropomyosin n=1 Tax=Morella rubra TaxID=262757 RepID=A0A6A1UKR0_9ROSI|nr:hypothetical protein CJ030_MR0G005140 [Morella rubra]
MAIHLILYLCLLPALFPLLFTLSETTCSASHNSLLMCELDELKFKVSQLESILEESTQNLNQRSLYLKEREETIEAMSLKIRYLQSTLDDLKQGETSRADERLSALRNEVQRLWAASRKNNFDIHNLKFKAQDAEERLEKITSQVGNMADFVTEQWIQIQRLEQALEITQRRARRQVASTRCTFLKFINNLFGNHRQKVFEVLDPYLFGKGSTLSSYISQALHQSERLFITARKYHHQLQGLIKQEMERNEFTTTLANSELVFILASALITFPIMGAWLLLSSQFS